MNPYRTITMPKCPYCKEKLKYKIGDYNTSKIVGIATGTGSSDVIVNCEKVWQGLQSNLQYTVL